MINLLTGFFTAFIITFFAIPSVIRVANIKQLYDEQGDRKLHHAHVPRLGGLAIFAGVMIAFVFWSADIFLLRYHYVLAAIMVIFFIGMWDDIAGMTVFKKFIGQLIAAAVLVFFAKVRLSGLYGVFGMNALPLWGANLLSLFTILVIMNAFNLIDGVDGLAAGVGVLAAVIFGVAFLHFREGVLSILAFSLAGALLAFLRYNFSPARIFMGDTGALVSGIILAVLTIRFIELESIKGLFGLHLRPSPALAIGILIVPLYDILSIFFYRILKGESPFAADQNHIHHRLLHLGMGHRAVALTLYASTLLFTFLAFLLQEVNLNYTIPLLFLLAFLLDRSSRLIHSHKFMAK